MSLAERVHSLAAPGSRAGFSVKREKRPLTLICISKITATLSSACHDNNTSLISALLDVWLFPEPIYTTLDLNNELVFGYTHNIYITIPT